jgi:hypothetical protein
MTDGQGSLFDDPDLIERLTMLEETVRASDEEGILARWQFGRELLSLRHGSKLPAGLRGQICQKWNIGPRELNYRLSVAAAYPDEKLLRTAVRNNPTWTELRNNLPRLDSQKPSKPRAPRKAPANPTATSFKQADKVKELIARPDVAAVLAADRSTDKATRTARAAIERREREAAREQKQDDQLRRQTQQVLRQRLIKGDQEWLEIGEHLETMADSVRRYLDLMPGMVIPNNLTTKVLVGHIGQLQQHLLELRRHLKPDYEQAAAALDQTTGSVITTSSRSKK